MVEKIVSPVAGSRFMVGVTHRPFLRSVAVALVELGVEHALVYAAIEGSDEAPLDGSSTLVRVRNAKFEAFGVSPESVGLPRASRAQIPWVDPEDEARRVLGALEGEEGPVSALILYNAALRLWAGARPSRSGKAWTWPARPCAPVPPWTTSNACASSCPPASPARGISLSPALFFADG